MVNIYSPAHVLKIYKHLNLITELAAMEVNCLQTVKQYVISTINYIAV